jgi:BirA family biotin operon repressor/biotin-[acetyl-CoA-carboxylase] ligase
VGVNVEWHEFPAELAEIATACNLEAGHAVDRRELLVAFLHELDRRYASLDRVPAEYGRRLSTLDRRVRVERPDGDLVGRAVGVGELGELLVQPDTGEVVEVRVGDVVHLRDT